MVIVNIIQMFYCWLVFVCYICWEYCNFMVVWMCLFGDQFVLNVWCVYQWVIFQWLDIGFNLVDFCVDSQYCVDKVIQFYFVFRFSWFNYQCICYWE